MNPVYSSFENCVLISLAVSLAMTTAIIVNKKSFSRLSSTSSVPTIVWSPKHSGVYAIINDKHLILISSGMMIGILVRLMALKKTVASL